MLHVLKRVLPQENESRINTGLMNREYEKNLEEYVIECFKSIEMVLDNIKMIDWTFTTDVNEIDMTNYERARKLNSKPGTKTSVPTKIAFIKKSRVGELRMNFIVYLSPVEKQELLKDEKVVNKYTKSGIIDSDYNLHFSVNLLVPIADETGRYLLDGVKFSRLYQLTEASTYITPSTTVLKSVTPLMVKRGRYTSTAMSGDVYTLNTFKVLMFKSFMNIMYIYLATMGWKQTMIYFRISDIIEFEFFEDELEAHPKYEYFKINEGLAIRVPKSMITNKYVQGMLGTILDAVGNNRYTYEQIMDNKTWIRKIGITKKKVNDEVMLELGQRFLILFLRMYGVTVRNVLRLENHNKKSIYAAIRWMVQNYDQLRDKDNLDFMNKRLRDNEQIAVLLNELISSRIKTLISTDANIAEKIINKYRRFFKYYGKEIISQMHSSGLIRSDDSVNDMDMFQKLKFTRKGPNSLGNKNSRNISSEQRAINPSEIGIDSLFTCSASDPGLTNYINPLCETDGLFFKGNNPEPENFYYEFIDEITSVMNGNTPLSKNETFVVVDPVKFCNLFDGFDDGIWEEEES